MENNQTAGSKIVPVLVVLLVVAAFLIGSLYTKVQFLEKKGGTEASAQAAGQIAGAANNPQGAPAAPAEGTPVSIKLTDAPVQGNKNAKVAIVEFTDFQCPFCGQLFTTTFPDIKKNYIDTGKVKYMVRDFPLFQIHPYAQKSAEASHCAEDQGKYWEYHDKLFTNQTALTTDDLKKYAADLGLNASQFASCVESGKYTDRVKKDQAEGEKYGVRGTPSSFVGIVKDDTVTAVQVSGAVPFDSFKATIEDQLKKV
jgi:protein-disulfide isomerase